ncbi:FAD-dependent oxidoreductase [Treponema sp. OttesenSCG-928-L16]|nr:FAD-dependent oxidoreductase [Treponema sp. OttesenSCG-928-L16]
MYDVTIIGCGIIGAAAAFELSRYDLKVLVLEKSGDAANGTTKANSAILHAGFDAPPGTLEAKLNLEGIALAKELCEKLDVERREIPTLVLAFDKRDIGELEMLFQRGMKNRVPGLRIIGREEALSREPNLNPSLMAALYAPGSAVVNPWEYAIALAETSVSNGAEIRLNSEVTAIEKRDGAFRITAGGGTVASRYVVNAGGCFSGKIHEMAGGSGFTHTNFAGQYHVLDKSQGGIINSVVFPCPDEHGFKGILAAPTVHGNLIVGPDAYQVKDGSDTASTARGLSDLMAQGRKLVPGIDFSQIIRQYAGVRPNTDIPDFIIGESPFCKNFINLAGIKSPGLSAAPAIARMLIGILDQCGLALTEKKHWAGNRRRLKFRGLNPEEMDRVIRKNSAYGRIVCRCETVTEGEIIDALRRPLVPRSINAVKRRCGAGLGRCQGGFCTHRILKIMSRELALPPASIPLEEEGSYMLLDSQGNTE